MCVHASVCVRARPLLITLHLCTQGEGGWEEAARSLLLTGSYWIGMAPSQVHKDSDVGASELSTDGREEAAILLGSCRKQTGIFPDWEREGVPRLGGRGGKLHLSRGWRKAEEPVSFSKGQKFVAGLFLALWGQETCGPL